LIQPLNIFTPRQRHRHSPKRPRLELDLVGDHPVYAVDAFELMNNPSAPFTVNRSLTMVDPNELLLSKNEEGEYDEDDDEDTRGVDVLIEWFKGSMAAEMRRVAGLTTGPSMEISIGNRTAPAPAATVVTGNESRTSAAAGVGSGIPAHSAGELEITPITWLDNLKNKPERWKGTAIGPPADDALKFEGGLLGED